MAARVTVQPATMRDASWVMAWLRKPDETEVMCQVPADTDRNAMAYNLLMSGDTFSIRWKGDQPIAFFGTNVINAACLSIWALGTDEMWRGVSTINRFLVEEHLPERIGQGYRTMEARSHADHDSAHRWLQAMGAKQHGPAFEFGRNGEKFLLFRWTSGDLAAVASRLKA